MSKKCLYLYLLFSFFILHTQFVWGQTYGLKFQGQNVTLDKRTELNLTPGDFLKFHDEFEISFDMKIDLIEPNALFGYIFRIINHEKVNVDLISTPDPEAPLNLVMGKNNSILPIGSFTDFNNHWINLRLKFILSKDRLILYVADSFYVQDDVGFNNPDEFKIIFGANDYEQFNTTDVPSMNIKNIKIFEKGTLKYHWLLDSKEGTIIYDRLRNTEATVRNPVWLMRNHDTWDKIYEAELKGQILFASDDQNGRIFLVNNNELQIYSVADNEVQTIKYRNSPRFFNSSFCAIYNSNDQKIYCYLVDEPLVFSLNIETGEWDDTTTTTDLVSKYRHHNRYYNASNNSIYLFGGYGLHKYNNIIRKLDLNTKTFLELPTNDSIYYPRYLAGLGELNDTIYILGGYGSQSGNQLINPHSFYDLFAYSIKDSSLIEKFEIPQIMDDMSVANTLWIDENTRNYYALIFKKTKFDGYLQLINGNIDSPEIELLGNQIPFKFLDVRSSAGLVYMPNQDKLIATTSYTTDSLTTEAQIFSISYPPNKFISALGENSKSGKSAYLFILVFILLSGAAAWYFLVRIKYLKTRQTGKPNNPVMVSADPDNSSSYIVNENPGYHLVFFGGFQTFDKNFEDITNKFSPLLKELFLLIVLHTYKNNKGISSNNITEILWFDKSEKSARNNRAVNIAKLKAILNEIGNCEITKKTGYWKLISPENKIISDYQEFLAISSSKGNLTKHNIDRLLHITEKGAFLQNVHYEWLDKFKAEVSDTIVDTLIQYAESCNPEKDAELIIHLADCVFNFDMLNEEAMVLKCRAEHVIGKHSLAKATYEKFCKEYQYMYNQEYKLSFLKILNIQ